jgi:hypothetical protein
MYVINVKYTDNEQEGFIAEDYSIDKNVFFHFEIKDGTTKIIPMCNIKNIIIKEEEEDGKS